MELLLGIILCLENGECVIGGQVQRIGAQSIPSLHGSSRRQPLALDAKLQVKVLVGPLQVHLHQAFGGVAAPHMINLRHGIVPLGVTSVIQLTTNVLQSSQ
ncbi:MAG: hypothetical protein HY741_18450 [Chloroflexi bacterium]|nr:hypothetical protein [Chloroflexota bacterium]